jgi:hypothetical protein
MRFRTAEERMDNVVMFAAEGTLTVRLLCRMPLVPEHAACLPVIT